MNNTIKNTIKQLFSQRTLWNTFCVNKMYNEWTCFNKKYTPTIHRFLPSLSPRYNNPHYCQFLLHFHSISSAPPSPPPLSLFPIIITIGHNFRNSISSTRAFLPPNGTYNLLMVVSYLCFDYRPWSGTVQMTSPGEKGTSWRDQITSYYLQLSIQCIPSQW